MVYNQHNGIRLGGVGWAAFRFKDRFERTSSVTIHPANNPDGGSGMDYPIAALWPVAPFLPYWSCLSLGGRMERSSGTIPRPDLGKLWHVAKYVWLPHVQCS